MAGKIKSLPGHLEHDDDCVSVIHPSMSSRERGMEGERRQSDPHWIVLRLVHPPDKEAPADFVKHPSFIDRVCRRAHAARMHREPAGWITTSQEAGQADGV